MNTCKQMTKILLIAAIVATSCGGGGSKPKTGENTSDEATTEQAAAVDKKLPFERGSYVEVSKVMGMELEKTVYFDRWGDWTATEDKSEITMMGFTHKSHKLEIVKGKTHWELDLIEKTGRRYELNFELPAGIATAIAAAIGGKIAEGMEMKELGEEDYLGYSCKKVWVKYTDMQMEVTTLTYGNLTMKTEGKMGNMDISTMITSINLNAPPASIFEVPDDVVIEEE